MKKLHIVILVLIAASIAVLVSFMGSLSTYETIASAKQKAGKTVTITAKMDNSLPVDYDPIKNPNYCSFHIADTLGNTVRAVYHGEKPRDMEKAEDGEEDAGEEEFNEYCRGRLEKAGSVQGSR